MTAEARVRRVAEIASYHAHIYFDPETGRDDALAVRAAAAEAVARARAGDGPTLLECATYRWSGHYVGDRERYRTKEEVGSWRERDPLARLAGAVGADRAAELDADVEAGLTAAAERARAQPIATADALLEHVWS